ncbi:MAG: SRPBCC family protein [Actinobacteria bacterium]|nr:SRPBCC family protein [Actinomycetota bacterium]
MAERTEGTTSIDAPPGKILDVIADFGSYPEWAEVKKAEVRETGNDGRPSQVYFEVQAGPVNARYTLAYTWRGEEGVSWTFVEGSGVKDLAGEYVLEPAGGSTRVTYRLTVDVNIPGPGFLKRKLMAEGEKRIIDTALKGLKARVEAK